MFELIGNIVIYCVISAAVMMYYSANPIKNKLIKKIVGLVFFPGWWITAQVIRIIKGMK